MVAARRWAVMVDVAGCAAVRPHDISRCGCTHRRVARNCARRKRRLPRRRAWD